MSDSSSVNCDICCAKLNKTKNKPIVCPLCNKSSCLECVKKYLLDTTRDFHCMFCRNKWNRDVLVDKLPQTFIKNELRKHQEDLIVNLEKARLPEAQIIAERRVEHSRLNDLEDLKYYLSEYNGNEFQKELLNVFAENYGIKDKNSLENTEFSSDRNKEKEKDKEKVKREFIKNCPSSECRGFIDKNKWSCGLCGIKVCQICYEELDPEYIHTCDPAIIESNKVIMSDSRPCPKCNALIFKISGCNQMFCTMCHTAFDWIKGTVETGIIHNPHYFQWKIQNKVGNTQNYAEIDLCDENVNITLDNLYPILGKLNSKCLEWIPQFLRVFIHMREVVRPLYDAELQIDKKMEINVDYMLGKISKTEWKKRLYDADKSQNMARDIIDVLDMANAISNETFRKMIRDYRDKTIEKTQNEYLNELNSLMDYVDNEFENIKKRYLLKRNILGTTIILDRNKIKDI